MRTLAIIPARYNSTRLPGKPLCLIGNKPMIQWVYERVKLSIAEVVVATDHLKIKKTVEDFGGQVVMTSDQHLNGTSRCFEAYHSIQRQQQDDYDVIFNIQGDEPFLNNEHIDKLYVAIKNSFSPIVTLVQKIKYAKDLSKSSNVFVTFTKQKKALYFSRFTIPFVRDTAPAEWCENHCFYKHLGVYAFKASVINKINRLSPSPLELAEKLEQNRWLENDITIEVTIVSGQSLSVDTPLDLEKSRNFIKT